MSSYFQADLKVNPWDSLATKTTVSTRPGCAVSIDDGIVSLIAPPKPGQILARCPASLVTVSLNSLTKLVATVVVDFAGEKWMVDFGSAGTTSRIRNSGFGGKLKVAFGAGVLSSMKDGKRMRDEFMDAVAAAGGTRA